jgi:hypothetical protein
LRVQQRFHQHHRMIQSLARPNSFLVLFHELDMSSVRSGWLPTPVNNNAAWPSGNYGCMSGGSNNRCSRWSARKLFPIHHTASPPLHPRAI